MLNVQNLMLFIRDIYHFFLLSQRYTVLLVALWTSILSDLRLPSSNESPSGDGVQKPIFKYT